MSSKSILIISSHTVSKLARFFEAHCTATTTATSSSSSCCCFCAQSVAACSIFTWLSAHWWRHQVVGRIIRWWAGSRPYWLRVHCSSSLPQRWSCVLNCCCPSLQMHPVCIYTMTRKKVTNFWHNFAICWQIFTIFEALCSGMISAWWWWWWWLVCSSDVWWYKLQLHSSETAYNWLWCAAICPRCSSIKKSVCEYRWYFVFTYIHISKFITCNTVKQSSNQRCRQSLGGGA